MYRTRIVVTLAFLVLCALDMRAAEDYNLSTSEGLSNSSVTCISQDSTGRLWIGTWDGLNVYNSQYFKIFRHIPGRENVISHNVIRGILEQRDGIMWVWTDYGINRIDCYQDRISCFYLGYEGSAPPSEKYFCATVSSEGRVFCSARGVGLAYYDEDNALTREVECSGFDDKDIVEIFSLGESCLMARSSNGEIFILGYSVSSKGEIRISDSRKIDFGRKIVSAFKGNGTIWLVSSDNFLYGYNIGSSSIGSLGQLPVGGEVQALTELSERSLMISFSQHGVYTFDTLSGELTLNPDFSDINVSTLFQSDSPQDILWVGTDGQGLKAVYDALFSMDLVSGKQLDLDRLSPVRAFILGDNNDLYVGTKGDGIKIVRDGIVVQEYGLNNGLANNAVYAFAKGHHNDIFVGHDGRGIAVISENTGKIQQISPLPECGFGSIYSILVDRNADALWIGSATDGLVRVVLEYRNGAYRILESEKFTTVRGSLSNSSVFPLLITDDNQLWIGTRGGGLNKLNLENGEFSHIGDKAIVSNEILCFCQSNKDSVFWIGTSYGLNKVERLDDNGHQYIYSLYTSDDGLENNTIHGILEDTNGKLWLSTNKGLSFFDPQLNRFTNYYNLAMLQDNEFSDGAYYASPDGFFYFGGVGGYNYFNSEQLLFRSYQAETIIEGLQIRKTPLSGFNPHEGVVLDYKDRFFNISFSAVDYIESKSCEYEYILEGFEDSWVRNGTVPWATFTNVPPGKYCFKVRCTNGDKVLSSKISSLDIQILRPWYATIWASLGYFFLLAALVYLAQRRYKLQIKKKQDEHIAVLKNKQLGEVYEAKLDFFTNIAQEFSTPLTLINGTAEQMLQTCSLNAKAENYNNIIISNSERLLSLVNELTEFRQIDKGQRKPRYSKFELTPLITDIVESFSEVIRQNQINIDLQLHGPEQIVCDYAALEKILYSLVSNSVMHSPHMGKVSISYDIEGQNLVFVIADEGQGIKQSDIPKVFDKFSALDRYEQVARDRHRSSNSLGLSVALDLAKMLSGDISVESELSKQTTFKVTLPVLDDDSIVSILDSTALEHPLTPESWMSSSQSPKMSGRRNLPSVMIVDDEEEIRNFVCEVLSPTYQIIEASNGAEAVERIKERLPDVIVSDMKMPEMDGMEFLKYVKTSPVTKTIPFIMLAFRTSINEEISAYECGCDMFISKPFSPKHLQIVIRRLLSSKHAMKDYFGSAISSINLYDGKEISTENKEFLMELTTLVEDNLTDSSLSSHWLCEQMHISQSKLYKSLKELMNQTPTCFITGIKLRYATSLLKTSQMTIQEVMFHSGFNNKSYFYRVFAKEYGMTPKDYRNLSRESKITSSS